MNYVCTVYLAKGDGPGTSSIVIFLPMGICYHLPLNTNVRLGFRSRQAELEVGEGGFVGHIARIGDG